jgi:hypothetical protein
MKKAKINLPEHDHTKDCPACKEIERLMNQLQKTEPFQVLDQLSAMVKHTKELLDKKFPDHQISLILTTRIENELTAAIGTAPTCQMVDGAENAIHEMVMDLANATIMPKIEKDLPSILDKVLKKHNQDKAQTTFYGKPGEA